MAVDETNRSNRVKSSKFDSRLVLLDAHAILHRAYHALPDFATNKGEPTGALYGLSSMLLKIIADLKPDYIVACYDVKGPTYRHEVFKEYKAGRVKAEDDLITQIIRSRDIFKALDIPIYDAQGFEADDILGTIVEQIHNVSPYGNSSAASAPDTSRSEPSQRGVSGSRSESVGSGRGPIEIIIASGDMDTLQLVKGDQVKVYTLKKGLNETIMYDEAAVLKRFGFGPGLIPDYKGLRGDPSDNIPGVKGIGEKTATSLIVEFGGIDDIYRELNADHDERFEKVGITPRIVKILRENEEDAEFSKMLATIRRDAPIKFELPAKSFKENIDLNKINSLWKELEFRTLPQRLEQLLMSGAARVVSEASGSSPTIGEGGTEEHPPSPSFLGGEYEASRGHVHPASEEGGEPDASETTRAADAIKKAKIALWLTNSNITDPKDEDLLNFAGTKNIGAAEKTVFAELDKMGLRRVFDQIEVPLIPVIEKMEQRGVKIDREMLKKLSVKYHAELEMLEKKIWDFAGGAFNINSPKQLGGVLFDKLELKVKNAKKTAGGARSTKESELEKMRDMHPIVPLIFDFRELAKLLSTYIDAIPPLLDGDNRLHTKFIQTGTTTGRMASQEPNIQNIPIKSDYGKAIRDAFVAEKGFKLTAFDYSQIELRIAAFLSGDEKLIEIFKKGEDVHTSVAAFVFKVKPEDVTPEMRRRAKVINFGIIYGMGVLALKQNLGTSREEAQNFLNDYFATFSTLAAYLERVKKETADKGYTETFFGRRRYFEGINSRIPYIKAQAERMAVNAPIQGTEADIIKLAMIKVYEYLEKNNLREKVFPILQVHDELVYEVAEDVVDSVSAEIKKIMESIISPEAAKGVPISTHVCVGDNWGELK